MNKGIGEQRNRLILLSMGTLGFLVLIWLALVQPLRERVKEAAVKIGLEQNKLENAQRAVQHNEEIKTDLAQSLEKLQVVEQGIAKGDIYRWVVNVILSFQTEFNIKFQEFEQPAGGIPKDLTQVAYQAATFSVSGRARYHDLGSFLAALENRYPYIRLQYLEIEPASDVKNEPQQPGKLAFKMELSVLVKPTESAPAQKP